MDRNEAIDIIRKNWPKDIQYTEALRALIPELKESEDERIRKELIKETKGSEIRLFETVTNDEFVSWLEKQSEQNLANSAKTCKDEQNPAWSEEDAEMLDSVINVLEVSPSARFVPIKREIMIPWLKSFKERCTWKPSDEQMEALKKVCREHYDPKGALYSLCEDLVKLKG